MADEVQVILKIGNPGDEKSATYSPLDMGDKIDVGAIIAEELEEE